MNPTTIVLAAVLGSGGLLSGVGIIYAVYTQIRDRRLNVTKQEGEIKLDSVTETRIAKEAAKINTDERIEIERWWKDQFDAVKKELAEEQRWRRGITRYIRRHQDWDVEAQRKMAERGIEMPPPPPLELNGELHDVTS